MWISKMDFETGNTSSEALSKSIEQIKKWVESDAASKVLEAEDLLLRAWEIAELIAKKAPLAVREAKRAIRDGLKMTPEEGDVLEEVAFGRLFDTEDQKNAMRHFLDKEEAPPFQGK